LKTGAQINSEAKIRLQNELIVRLRKKGKESARTTWAMLELNKKLWAEMESYDLIAKERQAHLTKVAFPDVNNEDVDAALKAGNNLNALYDLARGRAYIAKDVRGKYLKGNKGHLKIVKQTDACLMQKKIISSAPDVMGGTPVFVGTRVPVQTLIDYIEGGESIDDFLEGFPTIERGQVIAFLEEAKDRMLAGVA
jgi:uncharacterized protein (DUF433 family)